MKRTNKTTYSCNDIEYPINTKEGKKALNYCKDNYKENKYFSLDDLKKLEELF